MTLTQSLDLSAAVTKMWKANKMQQQAIEAGFEFVTGFSHDSDAVRGICVTHERTAELPASKRFVY